MGGHSTPVTSPSRAWKLLPRFSTIAAGDAPNPTTSNLDTVSGAGWTFRRSRQHWQQNHRLAGGRGRSI
jgi:hypothetical protein